MEICCWKFELTLFCHLFLIFQKTFKNFHYFTHQFCFSTRFFFFFGVSRNTNVWCSFVVVGRVVVLVEMGSVLSCKYKTRFDVLENFMVGYDVKKIEKSCCVQPSWRGMVVHGGDLRYFCYERFRFRNVRNGRLGGVSRGIRTNRNAKVER